MMNGTVTNMSPQPANPAVFNTDTKPVGIRIITLEDVQNRLEKVNIRLSSSLSPHVRSGFEEIKNQLNEIINLMYAEKDKNNFGSAPN